MAEAIGAIGFIGLGSMGGDQARELAKLSLPLTVFDISQQAMQRFQERARLWRAASRPWGKPATWSASACRTIARSMNASTSCYRQ